MKLTSRQIEMKAVNAITDLLTNSNILDPYIANGDKEPAWDGHIYIKKDKGGYDRIAVQVKGKNVRSIPSKPTYSVSISNLKSYRDNGGVIYFVVYLNGESKSIYYAKLAPIDLRRYIKRANGNATISIRLRPFNTDINAIERELVDFHNDCIKQTSFVNSPVLSMEDAIKQGSKIHFSFMASKNQAESFRFLVNRSAYLYAEISNGNTKVYYPIGEEAFTLNVVYHVQKAVSVNGKKYFEGYDFIDNGETHTISVKGCFSFTMKDNHDGTFSHDSMKFNSDESHLLSRLKLLYFMKALLEYQHMQFGDVTINLKSCKVSDRENLDIEIAWLERIKALFNYFNVEDDVDLDDFSEKDFGNISMMYKAIFEKKAIYQNKEMDPIATVDVGKYRFLLSLQKKKKNYYDVIDFFRCENEITYMYEDNLSNKRVTSIFTVALNHDELASFSNFDYEKLLPSYKKFVSLNPQIYERANNDILKALLTLDRQQEKNVRLLNALLELMEWILNNCDDNKVLYTINKYQIIKRLRVLTTEEQKDLINMMPNDNSQGIQTAIYLLLDNQLMAEHTLKAMKDADIKMFKSLPIFHFMNVND